MKANYIEIESKVNKKSQSNFYVAPSLSEQSTYFVFRSIGYKLYKEIRVRVLHHNNNKKELVHLRRLRDEEIQYFKKNIL